MKMRAMAMAHLALSPGGGEQRRAVFSHRPERNRESGFKSGVATPPHHEREHRRAASGRDARRRATRFRASDRAHARWNRLADRRQDWHRSRARVERPAYDGWFAGLVFDPQGKARFTVATYVRHGGRGGENAAIISAQLARYLIEPVTSDMWREGNAFSFPAFQLFLTETDPFCPFLIDASP